jgi:hypothetical protein
MSISSIIGFPIDSSPQFVLTDGFLLAFASFQRPVLSRGLTGVDFTVQVSVLPSYLRSYTPLDILDLNPSSL